MLAYRILRAVHSGYGTAVFIAYLCAFVFAFGLIFVFPPGALLLLFLGLFSLLFVVGGARLMRGGVRWMARSIMSGGHCPGCGAAITGITAFMETPTEHVHWRCETCDALFLASGEQSDLGGEE